jgi:hypothetical protein
MLHHIMMIGEFRTAAMPLRRLSRNCESYMLRRKGHAQE